MKSLLLLRHAKSSWKNQELTDHDRPLNKRGKRDAPRMGHLLLKEKLVPDLIVSSTAKRARKTAKLAAKESRYAGKVIREAALYHDGASQWYDLLKKISPKHQRIMLVGHNPELEDFLESLTGQYEPMPTAALALVECAIDEWSQFGQDVRGSLINVWRPREL